MVKLIPVLVSNSVSRNIIPGILKSIESYTMVYDLDRLLETAKKDIGIGRQSKVVRNKLIIKEGEDEIVNFLSKEFLQEVDPLSRHQKGTKQTQPESPLYTHISSTGGQEDETKKERESKMQPRDASVSLSQFDLKSLTLEPSWMKADLITKRGEKYSTLIGVKAIPVAVKSDAKLHELIMWDSQIGIIMQNIVKWGRGVEGILYRLWARTAGRIFNPDPSAISGNPYKDIVLKRTIISTKYVDKVYFVLNRADLSSDFFEKAKRVRQLTRLGWQSFVIADDVNRSVSFCMIKFRGMCSTMPYTMLYQTMNQAKIFDDLEDVRRSSASLFKAKRAFNKIIGEGLAQKKLEEFSSEVFPEPNEIEILNEIELLDENFGQFAKKMVRNPKATISRLFKQTIKLPSISPERIAKFSNKIDPDFHKAFKLSKKVIANSLAKVENETLINWASLFVVAKGLTAKGGKNLVYGTRETLKYLIPKLRKLLRDSAKTTMKVPPEHMAHVVFGTAILLGVAYFIIWTATQYVKGSFEAMQNFKEVTTPLLNKYILKTKAYLSSEGVNGSKIVNDSQNIAKDLVEKGQEMTETEEHMLLLVGGLFLTLGVILATVATIKQGK